MGRIKVNCQNNSYTGLQREDPPDVQLSKSLSWVCRHGAMKVSIKMDEG